MEPSGKAEAGLALCAPHHLPLQHQCSVPSLPPSFLPALCSLTLRLGFSFPGGGPAAWRPEQRWFRESSSMPAPPTGKAAWLVFRILST